MNKQPNFRKEAKRGPDAVRMDTYRPARGISHSARRSKKKPLVLILGIFLAVLVIVAGIAALFVWSGIEGGSGNGEPVTVVIEPGSNISRIAEVLHEKGVITSTFYFKLAAKLHESDAKLKPGEYALETDMPHEDLLAVLEQGFKADSVRVMIREGLTTEQTAQVVSESTGLSADEFVEQAKASHYLEEFPFLKGAYEDSLEGFLFPETYDFALDASVDDVITRMLREYESTWDGLDNASGKAAERNLSQYEVMTVAALIEKETKIPEERELVSSVIYNRLNMGMKLQLCSSVQFLLPDGDQRNKLRLTNADIAIESPFNTYINEGLPPRPIANPGKAAIIAALHPSDDDYIYFVLTGKDGSQTFAANQADFARAKAKSKEVFGE